MRSSGRREDKWAKWSYWASAIIICPCGQCPNTGSYSKSFCGFFRDLPLWFTLPFLLMHLLLQKHTNNLFLLGSPCPYRPSSWARPFKATQARLPSTGVQHTVELQAAPKSFLKVSPVTASCHLSLELQKRGSWRCQFPLRVIYPPVWMVFSNPITRLEVRGRGRQAHSPFPLGQQLSSTFLSLSASLVYRTKVSTGLGFWGYVLASPSTSL